jgi:hypothetical protein
VSCAGTAYAYPVGQKQCCKRDRDSRRETRSRVFPTLLDTSRDVSKLLDNSRPSELPQLSKKQREGNSRFVSTFLGHSRCFSMVFGRSRSRLGASFATLGRRGGGGKTGGEKVGKMTITGFPSRLPVRSRHQVSQCGLRYPVEVPREDLRQDLHRQEPPFVSLASP